MAYLQGADGQRYAGTVGIADYSPCRLGYGFRIQVGNERGLSRLMVVEKWLRQVKSGMC
jgi:hypothetical protein